MGMYQLSIGKDNNDPEVRLSLPLRFMGTKRTAQVTLVAMFKVTLMNTKPFFEML